MPTRSRVAPWQDQRAGRPPLHPPSRLQRRSGHPSIEYCRAKNRHVAIQRYFAELRARLLLRHREWALRRKIRRGLLAAGLVYWNIVVLVAEERIHPASSNRAHECLLVARRAEGFAREQAQIPYLPRYIQ